MVCGTTSDAGKSTVVAGICRLLSRAGVKVAPFKSQNMSLNSWVTSEHREIGRAQGIQALAAGVEPEVAMNPVLLKPLGEQSCQVVVLGEPTGNLDASDYQRRAPELLGTVLGALADLRSRFDVVIAEGAGSPAEINLVERDIANLRIAHHARLAAVIVGDIERGGVFAALHGTVELLPDRYRSLVRGFLINKLRGGPVLLGDACSQLEARCGIPTLGVLPFLDGIALDAEDSLALRRPGPRPDGDDRSRGGDILDVAVVRFPRLANATDVDALAIEPGVTIRFVASRGELGAPDLVVLPGTKATVDDLAWLRGRGLDDAIGRSGAIVLGICGGYQAMGCSILDPHGVEATPGTEVEGLGWLGVDTSFAVTKTTRLRGGHGMGAPLTGYEIHHGAVVRRAPTAPWLALDRVTGVEVEGAEEKRSEEEGAVDAEGRGFGSTLHGLFEHDRFRSAFLVEVARRRGKTFVPAGVSFARRREAQIDRIADMLAAHADLDRLWELVERGAGS
jgi:adenosylcobyric acid synthase